MTMTRYDDESHITFMKFMDKKENVKLESRRHPSVQGDTERSGRMGLAG